MYNRICPGGVHIIGRDDICLIQQHVVQRHCIHKLHRAVDGNRLNIRVQRSGGEREEKQANNTRYSQECLHLLFEFKGFLTTVLKACHCRLVIEQFLGLEKTVYLNKCVLNRVGCMHNILLAAHREIAPYGTRQCAA